MKFNPLTGILFILSVVVFGIAVPSSIFIGMAYLFAWLFNIPFFHAALICMGSTLVLILTMMPFENIPVFLKNDDATFPMEKRNKNRRNYHAFRKNRHNKNNEKKESSDIPIS